LRTQLLGVRIRPKHEPGAAPALIADLEGRGRAPGRKRPSHVVTWIIEDQVKILNVAGGRESRTPGIGARVERLLGVVPRRLGHAPSGPLWQPKSAGRPPRRGVLHCAPARASGRLISPVPRT
ncbi:MAG TPA: putative molybdenum carrier protein, partial [Isosphaeraceae bacterium]|nr:putative molybdenum carrier protein [Isosphaeraceae bacterium]